MLRSLRRWLFGAFMLSLLVTLAWSRGQRIRTLSFSCFQRRTAEDLIVSGYKVLGSAQRKSRTAVLQHGSLLLCTSSYAPQLPGINDLLSSQLTAEQLVPQIAENLTKSLGIDWRVDAVSSREEEDAAHICRERFASSVWTARR